MRAGDRLRRPAASTEPLRLRLSALGGSGRRWWFLDGVPLAESTAEAAFSHSFIRNGQYQLSVLDESGQTAHLEFYVGD
ncbi:penicillin-binding protein 1C [compost metagenome]